VCRHSVEVQLYCFRDNLCSWGNQFQDSKELRKRRQAIKFHMVIGVLVTEGQCSTRVSWCRCWCWFVVEVVALSVSKLCNVDGRRKNVIWTRLKRELTEKLTHKTFLSFFWST
jgi:hypothetical protein